MRILLVGVGEFYHVGASFRNALEACGHEYAFFDEWNYFAGLHHSLLHKIAYRALGHRPLAYWKFNRELVELARCFKPQVVLITKGSFISRDTLSQIKEDTKALLVNYATDDPFNLVSSSNDLVQGIPFYDLYACTKRAIMTDVKKAGCPNVHFVPFAYDPSVHFPESASSAEEVRRFSCDVVFVGGGDSDRCPYFSSLLTHEECLCLHLYGRYWDRDPRLRRYHLGTARGREYRLAVGAAKIAPCLVRRSNRDGHAMRTFEVPACGGFPLFERTEEHVELFHGNKEVTFFDSPAELADKVRYYLTHDTERAYVAEAVHQKIVSGRNTYKDRLEQILELCKPVL